MSMSIFIIFFASNVIIVSTTARSTPLIDRACSDYRLLPQKPLCLELLQSQPNIVSSTTQLDVTLAIMHSGASSSTNTLKHVEKLLQNSTSPDSKAELEKCQFSFKWSGGCFNSASSEVKDDKDYQTATYDLLIGATDAVQPCKDSIESKRINDDVIANGLREARLYGLSAFQAVSDLESG